MRRTIARARPTSAAATVITKMAKMSPVNCSGDRYTAKAMKLMLTACSISSTDIRMSTALRRASTPYIPSEKRMLLSTRKFSIGIISPPPHHSGEQGTGNTEHDGGALLVFHVPWRLFRPPSFALLAAGKDDRADERHQQHQRGDLERRRPVAEERFAQVTERHQGNLLRLARPFGGDGGEDREAQEGAGGEGGERAQ